jgi:hypothetical protein
MQLPTSRNGYIIRAIFYMFAEILFRRALYSRGNNSLRYEAAQILLFKKQLHGIYHIHHLASLVQRFIILKHQTKTLVFHS